MAPTVPSTIAVVVGRICQALPNVCSQMQICASASNLTNSDVARVSLEGEALQFNVYIVSRRGLYNHFQRVITEGCKWI